MQDDHRLISVVVPCFNEEAVVEETHSRLVGTLSTLSERYELVYVDDGSTDSTRAILRRLQAHDPNVRVVLLARNFGHQIATTAGLEHAAGDAVAIIDADLQDPPEVLLQMVEAWRNGADVAYGTRIERAGESRFKLLTAKWFYMLVNFISETPIPLNTGDFRLMDRRVVSVLMAMPERDRFLRGMVAWVGFNQISVPYRRSGRFAGVSKYPIRKMVLLAIDGIVSFSLGPLRLATWIGFVAAVVALLGAVYALASRLFTATWVSGWTSVILAILFLGGTQLISLGIIGEYLGRAYRESKGRPLYVTSELRGFRKEALPLTADRAETSDAQMRSYAESDPNATTSDPSIGRS